ncbi:uncharacterized protein G2W53_004022 [Senna tora]|uniref:Uncharacterized protein n=1 Tax=Senna tora TaxID=362788 RepID=A0A835CGX9_9FABA|nr:uncharacterized protein G2W53_004022 [Senna tora]
MGVTHDFFGCGGWGYGLEEWEGEEEEWMGGKEDGAATVVAAGMAATAAELSGGGMPLVMVLMKVRRLGKKRVRAARPNNYWAARYSEQTAHYTAPYSEQQGPNNYWAARYSEQTAYSEQFAPFT